jgi:hypothetical protein
LGIFEGQHSPGVRAVSRGRVYLVALWAILATATVVRLGVRVSFGESYFWAGSYSEYYSLAENVAAGKGFCFETTCAWWPPLYPAFLAVTALAGNRNYLTIVVPQAILGAGTVLCGYLIGRELFNAPTGLVAGLIIAIYPYYVMHDTALQETGMVTFWMALSVFLLLRARRSKASSTWLLAGLSLGALVLTRASLAPSAVLALGWALLVNWRKALLTFAAAGVLVSPWLLRTWRLTGAPVLSSQTGRALWIGNNRDTFSYYPAGSIDRSTDRAFTALSGKERMELDRLAADEIAVSDWFARKGLAYMRAHPWLTVGNALRKMQAGFSWTLTPNREPMAQAAYFCSYVPIAVLGIVGIFLARERWRECSLIYLLFVAFVGVTGVFWAHTSHRSYLDVYLIVFAASVLVRLVPRRFTGRDGELA